MTYTKKVTYLILNTWAKNEPETRRQGSRTTSSQQGAGKRGLQSQLWIAGRWIASSCRSEMFELKFIIIVNIHWHVENLLGYFEVDVIRGTM